MLPDRISLTLSLKVEDLVYCQVEAARRGIGLADLVTEFIDQGTKRLVLAEHFNEFMEGIHIELVRATRRAERELDVRAARRRCQRRRCGR
jgi:hypothetical protein